MRVDAAVPFLLLLACSASSPPSPTAAELAPFRLVAHPQAGWALMLPTGDTPVDAVVQAMGHEPNGPFWDGIAEVVTRDEPGLLKQCEFDSEAGTFVVYARDRRALERLASMMSPSVRDPKTLRATMKRAEELEYEFDD